ncbi:hypothetical protein C0V97_03955 [Asaia sp. W19]|uniref:hypothetical protein n=1 Tax=unclassified Asaia TaxID=2685023 RepID=UPI000F8CAD9D|nr:hypothetical protein [Asaia sp. W19]RUT26842.1 hypothetical protein C0V97_03955 [Asaia sp. W19]
MAQSPEKATTERRIHVLPVELLDRVRSYQTDNGIASEVEAVRRLLSEALQARDTIDDLMKQVRAQFKKDRDFRTLARDVLSSHILVKKIEIGDNELQFTMRSDDAGKVSRRGDMQTGTASDDGWVQSWRDWPPPEEKARKSRGWDSTDRDSEEIPF